MALFKRSTVWWMRFNYRGKQIRRSTETTNKKLAERIYVKVLGKIAEGKWFEQTLGEEKTFGEMMKRYMAEYSELQKKSSERDRSSLTHLLPFFGDISVSKITPMLINDYKNTRKKEGPSPATINRELSLLKHTFTLAVNEWGWANDNPVKKVSMEKERPSRDRWLTMEEEGNLLSVSPPWLTELIIFSIETGCRRGETLTLEWKAVDLYRKVITIHATKTEIVKD